MRQVKRRALVLGALAFLCLAAYVSASYILSTAVVDSGGGHAESSGYQLDCSIGGPVIAPSVAGGEGTSTNYRLEVGAVGALAVPPAAAPGGGGGGGGGCVPCAGGVAGLMALPALLACLAARRRSW